MLRPAVDLLHGFAGYLAAPSQIEQHVAALVVEAAEVEIEGAVEGLAQAGHQVKARAVGQQDGGLLQQPQLAAQFPDHAAAQHQQIGEAAGHGHDFGDLRIGQGPIVHHAQKFLGFFGQHGPQLRLRQALEERRSLGLRVDLFQQALGAEDEGAVGTFANIDPRVEAYVAEKLGLEIEPVSTQVIPRDRHAMYFATLGVIASSIERLATEIRHLQRTEVLEAEEYFSPGQKGSSAMPHKRNPVLTENLTGLARMIRGYVTPALENVALWHERDISHSSVERYIGPDATITLDFALHRMAGVIDKLVIYPERMQKNLDKMGGLVHSQRVLLALTQAGISREDSYRLVQRNAMKVWESDGQLSLLELLKADPQVAAAISPAELEEKFDLAYHLKHVDTIFARVFG